MEINIFGKCLYISKTVIAAIIVVVLISAAATGWYVTAKGGEIIVEKGDQAVTGKVTAGMENKSGDEGGSEGAASLGADPDGVQDTARQDMNQDGILQEEQEGYIKVCIVGCVKKPGIVKLKKGSIIEDAVEAAGGFTAEADLENINRVYVLNDNAWIKIRSKAEGKKAAVGTKTSGGGNTSAARPSSKSSNTSASQSTSKSSAVPAVQSSSQTGQDSAEQAGSGVEISSDSKGVVVNEEKDTVSGPETEPVNAIVNINTASAAQLETLPEIGPKTAQAIIEYRTNKSKFRKIEDIMDVKGIGEKKFAKIKALICV